MIFGRCIKLLYLLIGFALLMPAAQAVSIGEIMVQSPWGEALQAQVELRTTVGEIIEESCLLLLAPDAQDGDGLVYLTKATLGMKRDAGRQFVTISTSQPFKEMFAKIRLQVRCANGGGMTKVLTILPDLDMTEKAPSNEINLPLPTVSTDKTNAATADNIDVAATVSSRNSSRNGEQVAGGQKIILPPLKKHPQATSAKPSLKVSSEKFDVNQITQPNADNKALLQKLKELNTDDQIAAMLAMQNEIQKLRDELNDIKAKIQAASTKTPAALAAAPPAPAVVTSNSEYGISFWLGGFSGLLLLGMLGLRYFNRNSKIDQNRPVISKTRSTVNDATSSAATAKTPTGDLTQIISAYTASRGDPSDTDLMMEEAQLYAAHNRPQKAIQMLTELIDTHPEKMDAWLALFTNYASLHDSAQFEVLAKRFQQVEPDDHTWALVQSLGRTLERDHPLYQEKIEIFPLADTVTLNETPSNLSDTDAEAAQLAADLAVSAAAERFKPLEFELDSTRQKT